MYKIIISMFIMGLLFGSGPCIASCGPMLISYIAGTRKDVLKSLVVYILFSLAKIIVYLCLSMLIFFLGNFAIEKLTHSFSRYIFFLGGCFIVIIGLLMIFHKESVSFSVLPDSVPLKKFWQFLQKTILMHDKKSVVLLGLIAGLLPCTPLLAMLSYLGLISKSWLSAFLYSLSFGIGTFVSPLVLLVILAGIIPNWLKNKNVVYNRIFSGICGLILIFLGIRLIFRS